MWAKSAFLFVFGGIFFLVGLAFAVPTTQFMIASEPTQLVVVRVDEKWSSGELIYKPVFRLQKDDGSGADYSGIVWSSPKKHAEGDVVTGRYNPDTGTMQSDVLLNDALVMGLIFLLVGLFTMLLPILAPGVVMRMRWSSNGRRSWSLRL